MAGYTVLATRYRPRTFVDIVGQADAAHVLRAAIESGRSAHAYLFSGPRGVGKTSMARILAKAWNCLTTDSGLPCGTCGVCRAIDEGGDCLDVVEIDGASHNRVENVRDLIETIRFRPVEARHRVYIVDEVHMLSTSAFNALLKTLEEPPAHAKFILATTELLKVPETIRSRCQLIDFRRLLVEDMRARLADICVRESVPVPDGLLERIARHARGGLRDALSLLDQLITYGSGKPTIEDFERLTGRLAPEVLTALAASALAGDAAAVLAACQDAFARGARGNDLIDQLADILQGVLVCVAGAQPADRTPEECATLERLAAGANMDQVLAMLDVLVEASRRLRQRHDARLITELALLTLARVNLLQPISELLAARGAAAPAPLSAAVRPAGAAASSVATSHGSESARAPGRPPAASRTPEDAISALPPATPLASAGPAASPSSAASGAPDEFRTRFIEAASRGARSLGLELQRYEQIRVEADTLVLMLPTSGPALLFDPRSSDTSKRLLDAASSVTGRSLSLRVESASANTASVPAPAKSSPASASGRRAGPAAPSGPASAASAAAPTSSEQTRNSAPRSAPSGGGARPASDLEQRILRDWPGSERVDF